MTENENAPALAGVPDNEPFFASVRPGGRLLAAQVIGGEPPLATKLKPGYVQLTIPGGGAAVASTIGESFMTRLIEAFPVSGGVDESVPVTKKGYVPAVTGVPDTCPEALIWSPGGTGPDSVHLIGGVPPVAAKV
jgi:hypothetical protein